MKINTWMVSVAMVGLLGVAQAATITQSHATGTMSPGNTSALLSTFTFNKFNTSLGTLTGVTITLTLETWSGSFTVENTTIPSAPVSGTIQQGISGYITGSRVPESLSGASVFSGQNSGFDLATAGESFGLYGPTYAERVSTVRNAEAASGDFGLYEGSGTYTISFYGQQGSDFTSNGSVTYTGTSANLNGIVTVVYEYVPEPTSMALLALGCMAVGLRRRFSVKKA